MADLPANRAGKGLGGVAQAPLPSRVQADSFGSRKAQAAGGSLATGRAPLPRPVVTTPGTAQAKERFVTTKDGQLDAAAVTQALNNLQSKVAASTAQARANPFGNGQLFQNVSLSGTLASGTTAQRPSDDGLPDGFPYYDLTLAKPLWLFGGVWIDAAAAGAGAASAGTLSTTNIEHGFGEPVSGVLITNVKNAVISTAPRLVLAGNSADNNIARVWFSYMPLGDGDPTADFYLYG